jgi:hypothetical protein
MSAAAPFQRFDLPNAARFEDAPGGLARAVISTPSAEAQVYLQGAHLTHWAPRGQRPVLFVSSKSLFEPGKAISGGVPIIFPWFGPRRFGQPGPAHGFARTMTWEVEATRLRPDGDAKILTGGKRVNREGSFMQPTILTNVMPDNPAYRQEFFGPVALILPAKDEEEAIAIANDSPFGLGGSIYTKNIELGKRVASRIETGMVFINYPSIGTADLPFGGIKRSGFGKELSDLGIQEFVNKKLICASKGMSLVA